MRVLMFFHCAEEDAPKVPNRVKVGEFKGIPIWEIVAQDETEIKTLESRPDFLGNSYQDLEDDIADAVLECSFMDIDSDGREYLKRVKRSEWLNMSPQPKLVEDNLYPHRFMGL